MKTRMFSVTILIVWICGGLLATAAAQESIYSFSGDSSLVNKYIWRGQRLTNDWSFQPSMTLGVGNFSINVWGTMDLTAVNEGSVGRRLVVPENPAAPSGARGLIYRFSEVDYTLSYNRSFEPLNFDAGVIVYTFPDRSEVAPWTAELYGNFRFDNLPLAPSAALYIDIDEGRKRLTGPTMYFQFGAGHSFAIPHPTFSELVISGSLGLANANFGRLYYDPFNDESGFHDASLSVGLPIRLGESLSLRGFATYSALLRGFRGYQFRDLRAVYLGTAGSPTSFADTISAGATLNLSF